MDLEAVDKLLKEVSFEIEHQKRLPRHFNVFNIADVRHYETRHSAILAGLLGWDGSRKPLCQFLKMFIYKDIQEDELKNVVVSTEYTIDVDNEKRRIDILLQVGRELCVIIENKIYSDDHSTQLAAYYKWLQTQKYKRKELVYLTLHGSPSSEGFPDEKYIRLSYEKNIRDFLTVCSALTNLDERFNSTALQYAEFWENWFMESDELKKNVVDEILKSKENYQAAEQIFNAYREAKYKLISNLLQSWQNKIEANGYILCDKASEMIGNQYVKMSFNIPFVLNLLDIVLI